MSVVFYAGKKVITEEGGELHILVKEAKNLMAMKPGGTSDSFVKGFVMNYSFKIKMTHIAFPFIHFSFQNQLSVCASVGTCSQLSQRTQSGRLQLWRRTWTPTTTTHLSTRIWLWSSWRACVWSWLCGTERPWWAMNSWEESVSALEKVKDRINMGRLP